MRENGKPIETADSGTASALCGKVFDHARGFGMRVVVHLASFVAGVAAAVSSAPSFTSGIAMTGCVYIGLVCIFARGMARTPEWVIPALAGGAQTLALAIWGMPLPHALLFGGAQAWVQRLFTNRLRMGGEWLALILILPLCIAALKNAPLAPVLAPFAAIFVLGRAVLAAINRKRTLDAKRAFEASRPVEPEAVRRFRISLEALRGKVPSLPRDAQTVVLTIAATTDNILECMVADPRDIEPGNRFLKRYLTAAHTVVDKHSRLAREETITPDIIDALAQSDEMLKRLNEVFAKEHAILLQNDVTDFAAELNVLDTLLKMDGK